MKKKHLNLIFLVFLLFGLSACLKYKEFDFQTNKCKSAPSGTIKITRLDNLRYTFSLNSNADIISIIWEIDGKTLEAFQVNYQFDKKSTKSIKVTFYNRCLMASSITNTIDVY